ncbi:hypothetical protein [Rhizobium halophytocola]|uniref:J domain-containing protein n=1 Tax=Rhizobium halophytocola TaxID=735519 RepID=A0ABS4DSG3_9HYPH|nr:hypothetical protein [Rhizobium halophytocola]MBP1848630.1 hypothetical protein [Rhizobium halophytocola]
MLFGQSLFQSVLTRLAEEGAEIVEEDEAAGAFRVHGLSTGFVGAGEAQTAEAPQGEPAADPYAQAQESFDAADAATPWPPLSDEIARLDEPASEAPATEPAKPARPPHLDRLTVGEIAEDLGLRPDDSPQMIAARRRAFARLNHPDRVLEIARDNATRRMTVANMLADAALKARTERR